MKHPITFAMLIFATCSCNPPNNWSNNQSEDNADTITASPSTSPPLRARTVPEPDERCLPPARRFNGYAVGEKYHDNQEALNAGYWDRASDGFAERDRNLDSPREKRFDHALNLAFDKCNHTTPGSTFTDRITDYWLPQLKAMPTNTPSDVAKCRDILAKLESYGGDLEDNRDKIVTEKQKLLVRHFEMVLAKKRAILLPKLKPMCSSY